MALSERDFLARLQAEFGFRLGVLKKAGVRHAYPLSLVRSTQAGVERVVFVGNAARSLHPIAGQGFNLGLRDVAALGEAIADGTRSYHPRPTVCKSCTVVRTPAWCTADPT